MAGFSSNAARAATATFYLLLISSLMAVEGQTFIQPFPLIPGEPGPVVEPGPTTPVIVTTPPPPCTVYLGTSTNDTALSGSPTANTTAYNCARICAELGSACQGFTIVLPTPNACRLLASIDVLTNSPTSALVYTSGADCRSILAAQI